MLIDAGVRGEQWVRTWRPRPWVAFSTITAFLTGTGSFVYLVVTGNGDPVLVVGCMFFAGLIPPVLALEVLYQLRSPSGSQRTGRSSSSSSDDSSDGG